MDWLVVLTYVNTLIIAYYLSEILKKLKNKK